VRWLLTSLAPVFYFLGALTLIVAHTVVVPFVSPSWSWGYCMHQPLPSNQQQPLSAAPPSPRTPFAHCAAAAGVWFVANAVLFGVMELTAESADHLFLGRGMINGGIAWLLTASLLWGLFLLRRVQVKPWALTVIALALTTVMHSLTHITPLDRIASWSTFFVSGL